jgi:hypothetical protein
MRKAAPTQCKLHTEDLARKAGAARGSAMTVAPGGASRVISPASCRVGVGWPSMPSGRAPQHRIACLTMPGRSALVISKID